MGAVTFDLWHTLVYLSPEEEDRYMGSQLAIARRALSLAPRSSGALELSEEQLGRAFEDAYVEAVSESRQGRSIPPIEQLLRAGVRTGRRPSVEHYLLELEQAVHDANFHEAPGASELLRSLSSEGYWLGVISNTIGEPGAMLTPLLRSMAFNRYIRSYTFSDELPWAKPAPEIFWKALADSGAGPGDAVHVGDGWADIEGARRAGYRAGIYYLGLQDYGDRYRELFGSSSHPALIAEHRASDLAEAGRLIRALLPLP